jgi:hypothetical protein
VGCLPLMYRLFSGLSLAILCTSSSPSVLQVAECTRHTHQLSQSGRGLVCGTEPGEHTAGCELRTESNVCRCCIRMGPQDSRGR